MEKNNKFKKLEQEVKNYGMISEQVENKKLGKNVLVVMKKERYGKIMVFDDLNIDEPIGTLKYNIGSNGVYVSEFVVAENFQKNGIARMMWNLAMAHGDMFGKTCIYGEANPTDPIKGTSDQEGVTFEIEQNKINEIYGKLGCKVEGGAFKREWIEGEIINNLCENENLIVSQILENQKQPQR